MVLSGGTARESISLPFSASRDPGSWYSLSSKPAELYFSGLSSIVTSRSLTTVKKDSLLLRIRMIKVGPTYIIQGNLLISMNLI